MDDSRIPRFGMNDYVRESVDTRRKWLENKLNTSLGSIGDFTQDTQSMTRNIEHLIGVAQVPIGIAGPIRVNGDYAKGDFYVPLATTEGTLVKTYHRGMRVVSESGGVNVRILKDQVHISPAFFVDNFMDGQKFINCVTENFLNIKMAAEKTTQYGKLLKVEPYIISNNVILKFIYFTADAQGLNMINKATQAACKFVTELTRKRYILRSDLSAIKKVSTMNINNGQGKSLIAEVTLTTKAFKLIQTTAKRIYDYQNVWKEAVVVSGMVGRNIHVANILAAIFTACGQDIADVSMSHVSVLTSKIVNDNELYSSLYIPNLMVGTVGGGTGLKTQKECLNLMSCYGPNNAGKFAEIIAAAALAGEIACNAALENNTYVEAHEKYGRSR